MKKYDVVLKPKIEELIDGVNEAIKEGYTPIGGIISINGVFIQAIFLTPVDPK